MKVTISHLADASFAVGVVVLGFVALRHQWLPRTNGAMASPIAVGTAAPAIPGIAYSDADLTLIVAVSSRCRFCSDSMPFYRRLMAEARTRRGRVQFVAMGIEDSNVLREYLAQHAVVPDALVNGREAQFPLRATPTLMVVEGSGRVVASLQGLLTGEQETNVMEIMRRLH